MELAHGVEERDRANCANGVRSFTVHVKPLVANRRTLLSSNAHEQGHPNGVRSFIVQVMLIPF
jgi:hypothetical protein